MLYIKKGVLNAFCTKDAVAFTFLILIIVLVYHHYPLEYTVYDSKKGKKTSSGIFLKDAVAFTLVIIHPFKGDVNHFFIQKFLFMIDKSLSSVV